jgi:hypothetical protein
MSIHQTKESLVRSRFTRAFITHSLVLIEFTVVGCSSPSIVGEWHGEANGKAYFLTVLSDGTGEATEQGQPTRAIKWTRVKDKFEVIISGENGTTLGVTLRADDTLALSYPEVPEIGFLILKRKTGDR